MQIKFIGTGGAFDHKYRNSAALVTLHQRTILVDSGNSIYLTLREKDAIDMVDEILITHFHDDHVGSLSSVILHHKHFIDRGRPLIIYYPDEGFRKMLYDFLKYSLQHPEKYVEFRPLDSAEDIESIDTFGKHIEGMQTYSYIFKENNEVIAYSGDLGDPHFLFAKLKEKGLENVTVYHDIFFKENIPSHSYYKELERYMEKFKIFGYHCDPTTAPDDNKIPLVYHHPELLL